MNVKMQPHYGAPCLMFTNPQRESVSFPCVCFSLQTPSLAVRHTPTSPCFLRATETCCCHHPQGGQLKHTPSSHLRLRPEWLAFPPFGSERPGGSPSWMINHPLPLPSILATCLGPIFINEDFGGRKRHYPIEAWFVVMDGGNIGTQGGTLFQSSRAWMEPPMEAGVCAPLTQTHSSPDTPPASSILSAFTFLTKSIQNNAFYIFLSGL